MTPTTRNAPEPGTPQRPEPRRRRGLAALLTGILMAAALPLVAGAPQARAAVSLDEYPVPTPSTPVGITTGPDGNLWFTEAVGNKIGRMSPTGTLIAEYPLPGEFSTPTTSPPARTGTSGSPCSTSTPGSGRST